MKSIKIGEVETRLQATDLGFIVTRGSWLKMRFESYTEANEYFELLCQ